MAGADLLNGGTGTPAVLQRSESGQGILGAKEGRGMWLWSGVVVVVLSSHMSVGLWRTPRQCVMPHHNDKSHVKGQIYFCPF